MPRIHFTIGHMARIVWVIGWSDFFLKYRGSVLGYFWSFLAPLLRFLVILYIFQPLLGPNIPQYPLFLFLGLIVWEYFTNTTNGCMWMVLDKASIVSQISFPRMLLILAVGWTNTIIFLTHFLIFCLFGWFYGLTFSISFLFLVLLIIQMLLFSLGVGMVLSSYSLKFQDIRHLWEVTLQILFWMTPITYSTLTGVPVTQLSIRSLLIEGFQSHKVLLDAFIQFQPIALLIFDARRVFLYNTTQGMPNLPHILVVTVICGVSFLIGYAIFRRRSLYFLDEY